MNNIKMNANKILSSRHQKNPLNDELNIFTLRNRINPRQKLFQLNKPERLSLSVTVRKKNCNASGAK